MYLKRATITRDTWGYIKTDPDFIDRQYGESMTRQEAAQYWRLTEAERDTYLKSIKKGKYSSRYAPA